MHKADLLYTQAYDTLSHSELFGTLDEDILYGLLDECTEVHWKKTDILDANIGMKQIPITP